MLILTRRPGECIRIGLGDIDPRTPVGQLFANGPIMIRIGMVKGQQVRVGIEADRRLLILRAELRKAK